MILQTLPIIKIIVISAAKILRIFILPAKYDKKP